MMNITFVLYLTEVAININNIFGGAVCFYLLAILVTGFIYIMSRAIEKEPSSMAAKVLTILYKKLWLFLIVVIVSIFVPSKQTMYLMLGANYLQQSNLPIKVSQALELKLDDVIKSLKDKK